MNARDHKIASCGAIVSTKQHEKPCLRHY